MERQGWLGSPESFDPARSTSSTSSRGALPWLIQKGPQGPELDVKAG